MPKRKHWYRKLPQWKKEQIIANRWVKIKEKQVKLLAMAGKI